MNASLFRKTIDFLVADPLLHARWLNTLSLMENTGARKIAASESKTHVTLMVLKHAAEEARHAFYLKKQIAKLGEELCPDYRREHLVAPFESAAFLHKLDTSLCRLLKQRLGLAGEKLKYAAYLLVTYAIEVRADTLYPVYQEVLEKHGSRVNVKSIIAEEETHLAEMNAQMEAFFGESKNEWATLSEEIEAGLFMEWMEAVRYEIC